jgi:AmmeMemoRadiSam system protein B
VSSARPRAPAVAGQFYSADAGELTREIETAFQSDRGPGRLPPRHRSADRPLRAIVVPHAGYKYSGPIAALAYDQVARQRPPSSVLILGVDHHGGGAPAAVSDVPWLTPLGPIETDHELVAALCHGPVEVDERAHAPEHSIEVQVPFLQYVLPQPRIVALMVRHGPWSFLEEVAQVVHAATRDRDVLLVASTDFSHYVPPPVADRLDHLAIDRILAGDARGLLQVVDREEISMCGIAPTTVLLAALASEGLTTRLLRWGHSGEAEPMGRVVGYAALTMSAPPG